MKNVIKFLPVMAILLGSGLAVATTQKMNAHNVYWDPITNTWEDLTPYLPDKYHCPDTGWCTGYKDDDEMVWDITFGQFTPR